jgi:hypothetical protein
MFNIFNSNVFVEIGEAIGNLGRKVRRRSNPELVDRLFRKRLAQTSVELPIAPGRFAEPEGDVIDVEYRILDDEEVSDEQER